MKWLMKMRQQPGLIEAQQVTSVQDLSGPREPGQQATMPMSPATLQRHSALPSSQKLVRLSGTCHSWGLADPLQSQAEIRRLLRRGWRLPPNLHSGAGGAPTKAGGALAEGG